MFRNSRSGRFAIRAVIVGLVLIVTAVSNAWLGVVPVVFADAKATGSLIVDIKPVAARRDVARWRVDGGRWQKSGDTVSGLSVGQHTVTFKSTAGWDKPNPKRPSITANQTTTITGKYVLSEVAPIAAFSASPTSGDTPLNVHFFDHSTPGTSPITSWEWDFENDGVVDSTEQNPQPTFQDVGTYDVKLSVGSASGSNSLTKNDYINVMPGISQIIMLPGDVPLEMVWIPAGSFMMGRSANEKGNPASEIPQHTVAFANGFWIAKYEVTQAQWVAVMGSNPSHFTGDLSRPVEKVSWNTVQTYINAVNALGQGTVQLPTEAQWEYACRAGTLDRFYWGHDLNLTRIGNNAWYGANSSATTHPVGQKLPNAWGLYDMSGNVAEWCEDWFHYGYTGAPTDGSAWVSPTGSNRVFRGGMWLNGVGVCRSADRGNTPPSYGYNTIGFRLAGYFRPIAAFRATPTSGSAPLDVQFTDESVPSTSPITSWKWDFENDGTVDSREQHPAHTYSSAGVYDVALRVSSLSGFEMLTQQALIEVLPVVGPTAAFSATPTSGATPLEVQFTDESVPGTSPITSWAWDFENDGVVDSTEQHPAHTYSSVGDFDVTLTVSSTAGSDALTQQAFIEVLPVVAPTAAFSATPTVGLAPLLVQFTDESVPGTSPITSWAWDFENDNVVDSTEQNPAHTYSSVGDYDVTLTVSSTSGPDAVTHFALISAVTAIMLPGDMPLEMVWIPAGSFMMGRYENEQDSLEIEDPQHQVTFANGFWIGKYEVTQAQWVAVMGSNPSNFTGDLNRPVEKVSWETIQTFITAVNALGQGTVHLPSEAQWEYACRAGTATRFYWGDDLSYTQIGTYAWYTGNSSSTTHPVGQKAPNAWGLYDMSGNLWEWCEDWYHSSYAGAPADGSAWVSPTGSARMIRGGSWDSTGVNCRSAFRSYSAPSDAYSDIGFRLAK